MPLTHKLLSFWRVEVSIPSYTFMRMVFALLAILHITFSLPESAEFYIGSEGILEPKTLPFHWSTFWLTPISLNWFRNITLISLSALLVGFHSRGFTVVVWLFFVTLSQLFHTSGWQIDGLFCLWAFSFLLSERKTNHFIFYGLRLVQLQLSLIYFIAGVGKIFSAQWRDGLAVKALFGSWLIEHPFVLSETTSAILCWFVIAIEIAISISIWIPKLQKWCFWAGVGLHSAIFFSTKIKLLSVLFIFTHLSYAFPYCQQLAITIIQTAIKRFPRQERA